MKLITLVTLFLLLCGCDSATPYGKCIGFGDGTRNSKLVYKVSVKNAVVSLALIETIIVPAYWASDYVYCPIGKKTDE